MTKTATILTLALTALAAPGCYARAGYYAEPAYVQPAPLYIAPAPPTVGYARPYHYGYTYEGPRVYVPPRPVYVAPHPVYVARVAARPTPYRTAPDFRGHRR